MGCRGSRQNAGVTVAQLPLLLCLHDVTDSLIVSTNMLPTGGSLGFINRGTSRRSVWDICGDTSVESVRAGTLMVNRIPLARSVKSLFWGLLQ